MKRFVTPLAAFTAAFYAYTIAVIVMGVIATSCRSSDPPAPAPELGGWNNTAFATVNDEVPGDCQLIAGLCREQPQDLTILAWYFDADTDPAQALGSVANPPLDEDDEPTEHGQPDEYFEINTRFSENNEAMSHYSAGGLFTLYLQPKQLVILEITDLNGRTLYKSLRTDRPRVDTCFSF